MAVTGDCTEYAHLLAAACQIAGIPARVEFGMVYASAFGDWGGHAWNSAWDAEQGRWLHLDAAYLGVERSQYIRTGANLEADTNADAALDAGMGLLMGKRLEVVPGANGVISSPRFEKGPRLLPQRPILYHFEKAPHGHAQGVREKNPRI